MWDEMRLIWSSSGGSPLPLGEVDLRSKSGEGSRSIEFAAPPHPALRPDLSPPGRGCHTAIALIRSKVITLGSNEIRSLAHIRVPFRDSSLQMKQRGQAKISCIDLGGAGPSHMWSRIMIQSAWVGSGYHLVACA